MKNLLIGLALLTTFPCFANQRLSSYEELKSISKRFQQFYSSELRDLNLNLVIVHEWDSESNYASSSFSYGHDFKLYLPNRDFIYKQHTSDTLVLSMCHEIGHVLGGPPYIPTKQIPISAEGQSDYFSSKCFSNFFQEENNLKIVDSLDIPQVVQDACRNPDKNKEAICYRGSLAAKLDAYILSLDDDDGDASKTLEFRTKSENIVKDTIWWHPNIQCRLDTLFFGFIYESKKPTCWHAPKGKPIN